MCVHRPDQTHTTLDEAVDLLDVLGEGAGSLDATQIVLATGHSARDIYHMLFAEGVALEAKSFAVGVRIEHPQPLININAIHPTNTNIIAFFIIFSFELVCGPSKLNNFSGRMLYQLQIVPSPFSLF